MMLDAMMQERALKIVFLIVGLPFVATVRDRRPARLTSAQRMQGRGTPLARKI
jgi:hypothetical protein